MSEPITNQVRSALIKIIKVLDVMAMMALLVAVVYVITCPVCIGEMAACWFDAFMRGFLENISGSYNQI